MNSNASPNQPWHQPDDDETSAQTPAEAPAQAAHRHDAPHRLSSGQLGSIRKGLNGRPIVIIGMMGAGKSSIGRRLAQALGMGFADSDDEIEKAANLTIPEMFERHGEAFFRDGEHRVIARLLGEGGKVLALGGGAFEDPQTRADVARHGLSLWLKADLPTMMARVRRRANRPLLQTADPEGTMARLLELRAPNYALADLTVTSLDGAHGDVVANCLEALHDHFAGTSHR